ncbi:MAG: DUF1207 domain-containing protein [Marinifilum sp.]|jgi:hypothetical protein|nr:DUF1207 domain-containing protein [Marinifilum sp.]
MRGSVHKFQGIFIILIAIIFTNIYRVNAQYQIEHKLIGFLPTQEIFEPLLADPRSPHFSASLQTFKEDGQTRTIAAVNLGTSFALWGWNALGGKWQLGLETGVFSIFDLDAPSDDLINSDFRVGIPLSLRYGALSMQAKIYHQSSHLGDEYLLRTQTERVNLSYEGIDVLVSIDMGKALRIYGGGGRLIKSSPDLKEKSWHAGAELVSPGAIFGKVYPLVAFDFQRFEETSWNNNYSLRAGFEIKSNKFANRKLLLLFESFKGNSPNGQFYDMAIQTTGGGIHVFF